jgi:hypothetical protein
VFLPDPDTGSTIAQASGTFFFDTAVGNMRMDQFDPTQQPATNSTVIFKCLQKQSAAYRCTSYNIDWVAGTCTSILVLAQVPGLFMSSAYTLMGSDAEAGTETYSTGGQFDYDYVLDTETCLPARQVMWQALNFPPASILGGFSEYSRWVRGEVKSEALVPQKIGSPTCTPAAGNAAVVLAALSPYKTKRGP